MGALVVRWPLFLSLQTLYYYEYMKYYIMHHVLLLERIVHSLNQQNVRCQALVVMEGSTPVSYFQNRIP